MSESVALGDNSLELYIDSIELEHFSPFSKPRIKTLKATFDKKLQILNSTNGCGKSTFISELNFFPIDKAKFGEGGSKRVWGRINGRSYMLDSDHRRNYLYDVESGDNLNEGGTKTQLLAVLRQKFGITPFIWAAAMGSIDFTSADKNTRRAWVESISGIDFDYPFAVYKKITTELNSLKGGYKITNQQVTIEADKLLSKVKIDELVRLKNVYTEVVRELLVSRDSSLTRTVRDELVVKVKALEKRSKDTYKAYTKLARFINPFEDVGSLESLRDYHASIKSDISIETVKIENIISKIGERNELLRKLDKGRGVDINSIESEITNCTKRRDEAKLGLKDLEFDKSILKYINACDLADNFLAIQDDVANRLMSTFLTGKSLLDEAMIYEVDYDVYKEALLDMQITGKELDRRKLQLEHGAEDLEEMGKIPDVNCPECGNNFVPNGGSCDQLKHKLAGIANKIVPELEERMDKVIPVVEAYETAKGVREMVSEWIYESYGSSHYRWYSDTIVDMIESGVTFNALSARLVSDLKAVRLLKVGLDSSAELTRLEMAAREYHLVSDAVDASDLDAEVQGLEVELGELRSGRREREVILGEVSDTGKFYQKHLALLTELKSSLTELAETKERYIAALGNVALEAVESDLQLRLASVAKTVNDNDILVNLITSLNGVLEDTKDKIETFKIIEQAFNPSTGIIAEQLVGYVEAFATQLTKVIDKLWGYPMEVLPCSIEGRKGMDYLFPFSVGDKPVPDVAFGSTSQKSVINLAVMLCTRISLGLNGLPLFLDEVGRGFDTTHNNKLTDFIRELLSNYGCSNVFLVHHDAAVRNSLGPHDSIVFDSTQVVVEPNYNEHVEMTHYRS